MICFISFGLGNLGLSGLRFLYLRAKRCIVVAEQHCEATLIENYPGSTAKPNSDW